MATHRDDYLSSEENEKFQCSVCNKVLGSKTSLKSHLATHSGKPVITVFKTTYCTVCLVSYCHVSLKSITILPY